MLGQRLSPKRAKGFLSVDRRYQGRTFVVYIPGKFDGGNFIFLQKTTDRQEIHIRSVSITDFK